MSRLNLVVAEKVLADLAEFWEHPEPDYFGRKPTRIAGSPYDQENPEGIRNPYWEIVRQMPVSSIDLAYYKTYRPDPYYLRSGDNPRYFADRHSLCGTFAWSIISPGDVAWAKDRLGGRGIVEPGAGGGYWAWQLTQAGVDVAAYEPAAAGENAFTVGEPWFPVLPGDHDVPKLHPDRALLLCWPSYSDPWAAWSLASYEGDQLLYAGEPPGGCCADDTFFELLEAGWDEVSEAPQHVTFDGIHCYLTEYRRKPAR